MIAPSSACCWSALINRPKLLFLGDNQWFGSRQPRTIRSLLELKLGDNYFLTTHDMQKLPSCVIAAFK